MPNIKSAKKRVIVNNKKTEINKSIRSAVKTEIKKVDLFVKEGKYEEAKAALSAAFKALDSAAAKNIIHANNAANKKAKLSKKVASIAVAEEVKAPEVKAEPVVEEKPAEVAEVKEEKPAKKPAAKKTTKKTTEKPATKRTTKKTAEKPAE